VNQPAGPALARANAGGSPRLYLNLENITGQSAEIFGVYLNLPPGADPSQHRDLLADTISLFGIETASRPGGPHAGRGLSFAIDITNVVETLRARNAWDPNDVQVVLVPATSSQAPAGARTAARSGGVQVGRISVYQQ
jgi:tyrosinase